jgi:hypothetical protein
METQQLLIELIAWQSIALMNILKYILFFCVHCRVDEKMRM